MTQAPPQYPAPIENPKAAAKAAKAYAKAVRPRYKKKRFLLPVALVVVVAIISGTSGSDQSGPKVVDDASSSNVESSDSKGQDREKSGPAERGTKGNPVRIGQTVELEGTRYTVESAKTAPRVGNKFFGEEANGIYVIVALTIENTKDESKIFSDSSAQFVAEDDTAYGTDSDATIANVGDGEEALFLTEMHPDLPTSGTLIFDVPPAKAQGGLLEVSDLFGGGEAYIALGLK